MSELKFDHLKWLLLVGAIYCWTSADMVFMQDEVSALSRLNFNSFSDLIRAGVMTDFHPAFVQVFLYYWTALFGVSEFAVKLPSMLMGVGSLLLAYRLTKRVFSEYIALMVLVFMAFSQYYVLYFSLARPYAYGVFFILLQLYALIEWRYSKQRNWSYIILFITGALLASWTHYFSMMTAGLIGVWGLFWIQKVRIKSYLLSCIAVLGLYSPHISVTMFQLSKGGIGGEEGWLGAPDSDFFWNFCSYFAQYNSLLISLLLASVLVAIYRWQGNNQEQKMFIVLGLGLLIIPFSIGFFYSVEVNPIIQYSVLIFGSIPALVAVLSAWMHSGKLLKTALIITFMCCSIFALYSIRFHPQIMSQQPLDELAQEIGEYNKKGDTPLVFHAMNSNFLGVYEKRDDLKYTFHQVMEPNLQEIFTVANAYKGPLLAALTQPSEAMFMLQDEFGIKRSLSLRPTYEIFNSGVSQDEGFVMSPMKDIPAVRETHFEEGQEFADGGSLDLTQIDGFPYLTLVLSAEVSMDTLQEGNLVSSLSSGDSSLHWLGRSIMDYSIRKDSIYTCYLSLRLQDVLDAQTYDEDLIWDAYYWNNSKGTATVSNLRLRVFPDSPTRYGLYEPFPSRYFGPEGFFSHSPF